MVFAQENRAERDGVRTFPAYHEVEHCLCDGHNDGDLVPVGAGAVLIPITHIIVAGRLPFIISPVVAEVVEGSHPAVGAYEMKIVERVHHHPAAMCLYLYYMMSAGH